MEREATKISNSQLGELLVHEDSIISFREGIFGYEYLKHFALVELEETEPFIWMIAIEEPEISLPMLRYKTVFPEYELNMSSTERKILKLGQGDAFHLFFIVTVNEEQEQITANLKGPIVINLEERLGAQVVAPNEEYVIHYPVGGTDHQTNE
ncbi:flagellar assembly protein FliW [candidate division KSB1 bacterium]|nr:flagellar assembly protein FliW [candidate division KSB1 bacterium]